MRALRVVGHASLLALHLGLCAAAWAHGVKGAEQDTRLPVVGTAAPFTLINANGRRLSLSDLRGKVLALTFIYASCTDTCSMLTAKLVDLQQRLGADFGPRIAFVAVTVNPEIDTPAVLGNYAKAQGATAEGWHFLTGSAVEIKDMLRRYGVFARKNSGGDVDHLFITSLIDRKGMLRVQYLGVYFNQAEMQADLQKLLRE